MLFARKNVTRYVRSAWTSFALGATMSLITFSVEAQDQTGFTHFFINPYVLNSSYAGLDGQPAASIIYRRQWMTIDGAPTITNLSLHAPMNDRVGAGVNITNDSKGFFNNTTLLLSAAYHVPVGDHSFVRFGLSAGGSWNTIDMKKLEGISDPALGSALDQSASLAGNAGVSFHHKTFNAGIALPALFSPSYVSEDAFSVKEVKPFEALTFHATNRFYFNHNKNIFEPYLLYHLNTALPSQVEVAGIVHLNHLVWAGVSYKQDFGISGLGGVKLKNSLAIGASYSIPRSGVDVLNSPSFEVSLNYLFGKHRKNAPVYSFVNAVKQRERAQTATAQHGPTWRQKQIEAEQRRRDEARQHAGEVTKTPPATAESAKQQTPPARTEEQPMAAEKPATAPAKETEPKTEVKQPAKTEVKEPAQQQPQVAREEPRPEPKEIPVEREPEVKQPVETAKTEPEATTAKPEVPAAQPEAAPQVQIVKTEPEPVVLQPEEAKPVQEEQKPVRDEPAPVVVEQAPDTQQPDATGPVVTEQAPADAPPKAEQPQEAHPAEPAPQIVQTTTRDGVRHEIMKRGSHTHELEASQYVVVGSFKSIENAKHFSEGLRSLNYNTRYGHLTPTGLWYVYILKTDNLEAARAEQKRITKTFLLRDAWILTVQP